MAARRQPWGRPCHSPLPLAPSVRAREEGLGTLSPRCESPSVHTVLLLFAINMCCATRSMQEVVSQSQCRVARIAIGSGCVEPCGAVLFVAY